MQRFLLMLMIFFGAVQFVQAKNMPTREEIEKKIEEIKSDLEELHDFTTDIPTCLEIAKKHGYSGSSITRGDAIDKLENVRFKYENQLRKIKNSKNKKNSGEGINRSR